MAEFHPNEIKDENDNTEANTDTQAINQTENPETENAKVEKHPNPSALLLRLIGFILCSLIYLLMLERTNNGRILSTVINRASGYFDAIMLFSHIMSIVALIIILYYLLHLIKPKQFPFSLKTKSTVFAINILDWIMILPICVVISTFCFTFLFTVTEVNGSSMEPTLKEEDQLVLFYKNNFERFDIIVIHVTPENYNWSVEKFFIKRIIGLPGERVDYILNPNTGYTDLYINGVKMEESFFLERDDRTMTYLQPRMNEPFEWEEKCVYREDGIDKRCSGSGDSLVIPEGYYLALGDNRIVSEDSRTIGLIHHEDILGIVRYRLKGIALERLQ